MARQIRDQLASGMQNSVVCSEDVPFFHLSDGERQRIGQTYQGMDQLDALGETCKLWPRGPVDADLHAPLQSTVPALLLSGEADPVTPPADADPTSMPSRASNARGSGFAGGASVATSVCAEATEDSVRSAAARSFVIRAVGAHRGVALHHHGHRFHVRYEPASKIAVIAHAPNRRSDRSVHGFFASAHSSAPAITPHAPPPAPHATSPR